MNKASSAPETTISAQRAVLRVVLDDLLKPKGPFDTLMQLIRGNDPSAHIVMMLNTIAPVSGSTHDKLFGHHGLGGEFGNSIGAILMHVRDRISSARFDGDYATLAERVRHCWRDKISKATEYNTKSENVEHAMRRIGVEIRTYIDGHVHDANNKSQIHALMDQYDAAINDIDAAVKHIESCMPARLHTLDKGKDASPEQSRG